MNTTLLLTLSEEDLAQLVERAVAAGVTVALERMRDKHVTATQLLTRTQLAEALQYTTRTITKLISLGMPSTGIGFDRRFRLVEVEAWLKTRHDGAREASLERLQ